jgi:hypothetical protein
MLSGKQEAFMSELTLENHPLVEHVHLESDPDGQPGDAIAVVETNIVLDPTKPGYDAGKIAELTRHVEAWQAQYQDRQVRIDGVA